MSAPLRRVLLVEPHFVMRNTVANVARRTSYVISISYKNDVAAARSIILSVLEQESMILVEPKPLIVLNDLNNNASNLYVRFWSPTVEWWDMTTKMLERRTQALDAEGIQIALPQRMIWYGEKDLPSPEDPER